MIKNVIRIIAIISIPAIFMTTSAMGKQIQTTNPVDFTINIHIEPGSEGYYCNNETYYNNGFDYLAYLSANPDLPSDWGKVECMNHYKLYGFEEGRAVAFNLEEYLNANPDLPTNWTLAEGLSHYNMYGKFEHRILAFDAPEYISLYPDLPQDWTYEEAFAHYANYGKVEGRIASFDETAYLELYEDLPSEWRQAEAFCHYICFGQYENRVYDPYDESVFLEGISGEGTEINGDVRYSFGVHPSSENAYTHAMELGIDFNREGVYFVWDWVDPDKEGGFSFKNSLAPSTAGNPGGYINYDNERARLLDVDGIALMNNVCPFRGSELLKSEFRNEEEKKTYQLFVEKMVERYDGDSDLGCTETNGIDCYHSGDNEYPSQELISILQKNPIKHWQVCNQVTDVCDSTECKNNELYAEKYTEVMELTYNGIKTSCPDCQVLIGGDSGKDLYPPVYNLLAGKYIDIIDKHFFGEKGGYADIPIEMDYLKDHLVEAGFNINNLRFWITEIGTYSGDPVDDRDVPEILKNDPPFQTEKEQARELIKRYAVSFGYGIEKVLWAWGLKEGFNCDCCQFDYTGLIYDGNKELQACDENDPYDRGDGIKKLAYYSFKLMTQKLKGFTSVETIEDSNGTYVFKFFKNGTPVYIAWSENVESVMLNQLNSDSIKITEAVPNYEYGDQVVDFDSSFFSETKPVNSGNCTINLDVNPIFIEGNY